MKKILYIAIILSVASACSSDPANPSSGSGIGGSMATFTIAKEHLYVLADNKLNYFSLSDRTNPAYIGGQELDVVAETLYPHGDNLFIGTQEGMYIYDISNPGSPRRKSVYQHIVSCDPVAANDSFAYVTLRDGTECRRGVNRLDIIDITNIKSPQLLNSINMKHPHGLGLDDTLLFVCEGKYGLRSFSINEPDMPDALETIGGVDSYDLIPYQGILMVIGKDGLHQYSYDSGKLELLSQMMVTK